MNQQHDPSSSGPNQLPPGQGPVGGPAFQSPPPTMYGPPGYGQPGYGPAMYGPPVYPPPRGPSFAKIIFTTLAVIVLVISLLLNVVLLIGTAFSGSSQMSSAGVVERVVQTGATNQTIALLRLNGVIMGDVADKFVARLEHVRKNQNVKAIVIEIDSPGGAVTESDEIYAALQSFKSETGLPVYVSMAGLAASGGYYVACAGDQIYAQPTTLTGSIGVLLPRWDLSELGEKYGINDGTIVSDGTPFKNAGSAWEAMTPEQTAYLESIANDALAEFKRVISEGRANRLKLPLDEIANGKIYSSNQAYALGLIDQRGYLHDAISAVATTAGLTNPRVIEVRDQPTFFDVLGGVGISSDLSQAGNISIDAKSLMELTTVRPMYLWKAQ